jgi:hypothetical protein
VGILFFRTGIAGGGLRSSYRKHVGHWISVHCRTFCAELHVLNEWYTTPEAVRLYLCVQVLNDGSLLLGELPSLSRKDGCHKLVCDCQFDWSDVNRRYDANSERLSIARFRVLGLDVSPSFRSPRSRGFRRRIRIRGRARLRRLGPLSRKCSRQAASDGYRNRCVRRTANRSATVHEKLVVAPAFEIGELSKHAWH